MPSSPIDTVDRAILHHLQQDATKPITDIAEAVNVADNTVRNRIQNLEAEGIIESYQANINYDAAGVQHHYVFVCSARVSEREQLAGDARELHGVTEVITLMTGTKNVFVIGSAEEKNAMSEMAYDIDHLGLAIEQEHLIREHVRQPFSGFRIEENI